MARASWNDASDDATFTQDGHADLHEVDSTSKTLKLLRVILLRSMSKILDGDPEIGRLQSTVRIAHELLRDQFLIDALDALDSEDEGRVGAIEGHPPGASAITTLISMGQLAASVHPQFSEGILANADWRDLAVAE
jgi:hypothetical protein